jgi:hypothetical protein
MIWDYFFVFLSFSRQMKYYFEIDNNCYFLELFQFISHTHRGMKLWLITATDRCCWVNQGTKEVQTIHNLPKLFEMQATYVLQNIYTVNNLHRLKTGTVCSSKGMVATYKITRCHKTQAQRQEFHVLLLNILSPHIKRALHWMKPLLLLLPSHKLTRSSCGIRCNADRTRNTYQDVKIFIGIVVIMCYENRFFNMRNPMDHTRLVKLQLCRLGLWSPADRSSSFQQP